MAMYALADKMIARLSAQTTYEFSRLAEKSFDQLNIIRSAEYVSGMFRRINTEAKRCYLRCAKRAYDEALDELIELGYMMIESNAPDAAWIKEWLGSPSRTTRYIYTNEVSRKRLRVTEEVTTAREYRDRRGLRYTCQRWSRNWQTQTNQYMIDSVYQGRKQAFIDCGVTQVRWVTMADERVCKDCAHLDGQVFDIDHLPERHWNCRCWFAAV